MNWSSVDIHQYCTLTKRQAGPLYSRILQVHTHTPVAPPSLAHWIGIIQTYQHFWQPQLWPDLCSASDGLRWAKVVSLSPFTHRSEQICHTSGQHMLWETAAPPLSCLFVCLGSKPPWNGQFRPLEGVRMCVRVWVWLGWGGGRGYSGVSFPTLELFLPPLTAHNYARTD